MASINYAAREINVKIVYYGPGLSGKTTNLQVIHRKVPPEYKSDMVSLATETDRTLFFDFLPLDLGKIKGFSTKFQLYTVPGQVYYNATRKLVLRGVDGIVFVADSGPDKIEENIESFQNLEENLAEYGYKRENIPTIIQYNKRDIPNALSVEEMHQHVNKYNLPWSEAVANKGVGVFDSLKLIGKIVIDYLNKKYSKGGAAPRQSAGPMQQQRPMQQPMRPQAPQQGYQGAPQFGGAPQNRMMPPQRPSQAPSMYNQLGQQMPQQSYQQPGSGMNRPFQQPQYQPRQPITPPMQMPPPGFRPQQQQRPQNTYQQPMGYQPSAMNFQQPQPGMSRTPMAPQANEGFNEEISFEPQASSPPSNQPAQQNEDFYNYGSINLEPMNEQQMPPQAPPQYSPSFNQQQSPSDSANFDVSGKTDLDLEIERYQREIEDKQRRSRSMGPGQQPQAPQQPPQVFEQPSQHEDYEVYNMEMPAYGGAAPQQQPQQQNSFGNEDEEMFFTSVDRDRQKKPVKRPMNPRASTPQQQQQQDKGFLSKFFKKDMP